MLLPSKKMHLQHNMGKVLCKIIKSQRYLVMQPRKIVILHKIPFLPLNIKDLYSCYEY